MPGLTHMLLRLNPVDIPWYVCLPLAVGCYLLSRVFGRKEEQEPWRRLWPVLGGVTRVMMVALTIIGAVGLVRWWR